MSEITLRVPLQRFAYLEITGGTASEVAELASDALIAELHSLGIEIEAVAVLAAGLAAPEPVQASVAATTLAAEPSPTRSCEHGVRSERSGVSHKGPWTAYFCALPKGSDGECPPQWK
jgi:hypothetical protein